MDHCIHLLKFSTIMITEHPIFGIFHCVASFTCSLTAIFGNSLIIYASWNASPMPQTSRILLLSLAASDLGIGLIVLPINTASMARLLLLVNSHDDKGNHDMCLLVKTFLFFTVFFAGASLFTMGAIAIDRYLALSLHLRYQELVTPARTLIVVTAIWIASLLSATLQTLTAFNDIINSSGEVVAIVVASYAYIKIYKIARHHHNQIHDQAQLEDQNDQTTQMARARKLAINTLYIYVILVLCYVPSICISPIFMMSRAPSPLLTLSYYVGASLIFYNSSLNPLMYCWKIREVREVVVDILKRMFSRWIPCTHA